MSKKRQKESGVYSRERKKFLEANPICQVCMSRPSNQIHHVRGRGRYYLDENHWLAVDDQCHDFITRNPALSFEMGYREKP